MKRKKSRLALIAVSALALSVTVGLATGSVADAKKKKKSGKVTVSKKSPTTVPARGAGPADNDTMVTVPLTVGKKAKGKVVGWDTLTVTTTFSSPTTAGLAGGYSEITAPNGRTEFLNAPIRSAFTNNTTSGPLTETPNSPFVACFPTASHPCPGGSGGFPEATVGPPYQGTIQNEGLEGFGGVPAKGTWQVKIFTNSTTQALTLDSVSISMTLKSAPQ